MTPGEKELAQRYAQQGFDWIKEHGAKYDVQLSRIDPSTLFVNTMNLCPLAQASGQDFGDILLVLYREGVHRDGTSTGWCREHGFLPFGYDGGHFLDLQWRKLIAHDRSEMA